MDFDLVLYIILIVGSILLSVVKTLKKLLPGIKLWHTIAAAMDKKTTHWSRL